MATPATVQPSKLLQIPPEIRSIIYGHLFKDPSREIRFYFCCDGFKIIPGLSRHVLLVCHQFYDEASVMIDQSLSLKVEHCNRIALREKEIELNEYYEHSIDIQKVLRQCTGLTKLMVTCDTWELELNNVANQSDGWWLENPWVAECTWKLFEEFECWQQGSIWKTVMKTKKGADRAYDIEFIVRYDMLGAAKILWNAFDLDTQTAVRRWLEHFGEDNKPSHISHSGQDDGEEPD